MTRYIEYYIVKLLRIIFNAPFYRKVYEPSQDLINKIKKSSYLVIHHTGVPFNQPIEEINMYHFIHNKWDGIGYDVYINTNGIYETFRIHREGSHARGYNHISVGICFSGSDHLFYPSYAKEYIKKIKEVCKRYNVELKYHYQLNDTNCMKSLTAQKEFKQLWN